jgi:hypothetical protein
MAPPRAVRLREQADDGVLALEKRAKSRQREAAGRHHYHAKSHGIAPH